MSDITDEMLDAYVDGALDDGERRAVEAHLAEDAGAQAYVEALRRVNALAPDAMDALLGPVPQSLIETLKRGPGDGSHQNVVAFEGRRRGNRGDASDFGQRYLVAAALALCMITATGYVLLAPHLGQGPESGLIVAGPVTPGSPLAILLEDGHAGTATALKSAVPDAPLQATVLATFKDGRGRFCRELEVMPRGDSAAAHAAAIACRADDRTWVIEGAVAVAASEAAGGDYVPSGTAHDDPLAPLVRSLDLSTALSSDEDRAAVATGWKR
jgi:hypothetical protein